MRIALQDELLMKFTNELSESWTAAGHEVHYASTFSPNMFSDFDVTFIESAASIMALANRERPRKGGKVFVRVMDIDAYLGAMSAIQPDYVDGVIFVARHIQTMCNERYPNIRACDQHLIPMGIDLDKHAYRGPLIGHEIGFVSTQLSQMKGFDIALQLFARLLQALPEAELHIVGQKAGDVVWLKYIEHLIVTNHLEDHITWHPRWHGEMADFWNGMTHMLLPSKKEAFSLVTGECMAIGVKPVVNSFWGARDIWPEHILFRDPVTALDMLMSSNQRAEENREYVVDRYDLRRHIRSMNTVLGLGGC